MTFLTTFISIKKLYKLIKKLFSILGENIKQKSWFFSFFMLLLSREKTPYPQILDPRRRTISTPHPPPVPREKPILLKERESGWDRVSAYYLAKTMSEMPLTIALPTLYFLISYPMMTWASSPTVMLLLLLVLLLNSLVAQVRFLVIFFYASPIRIRMRPVAHIGPL